MGNGLSQCKDAERPGFQHRGLRGNYAEQKKVALIIHARDQGGNPIAPSSVKDLLVMEHGKKLQVVNGPTSARPKQIALLLDSNLHQRRVMALEQQTALELIPEFEKEKAQVLVMSYGAEIHSSGELTDDWTSLKKFRLSLSSRKETTTEVPSGGPAWRDWRNEGISLATWLCSRTTVFMAGRYGITGTTWLSWLPRLAGDCGKQEIIHERPMKLLSNSF